MKFTNFAHAQKVSKFQALKNVHKNTNATKIQPFTISMMYGGRTKHDHSPTMEYKDSLQIYQCAVQSSWETWSWRSRHKAAQLQREWEEQILRRESQPRPAGANAKYPR